jgi:hypothetical protein
MGHAARSLFVLAFAIASLGLAQPTAALAEP